MNSIQGDFFKETGHFILVNLREIHLCPPLESTENTSRSWGITYVLQEGSGGTKIGMGNYNHISFLLYYVAGSFG
ncbi:hypothetical protein FRX31_002001 [Thalictrum thalictroides]|uniref:Uncharacterized protein n=1 Tax=Thalictrum thalictroides TaxID=46969 RepID=A0A7J6XF45_THATH|nr:hypothetical protein FRX31_002001 [Thalictrum thalictroides]